ncbi:protein tyrosine/serine phosphatase domain-containing protein [Histoplasma capsulatum]|uniref:Protein tyrosine/serine phosphatase domain-containing protein n=1 Tax=Ajellomyces capsulatus TaxID=5037 RepID=A0A8A1MBW9_AJECA|nr:protein tyrosine/serine phosphatase domain-containing protein [Histoplasma capsulatum]
MSRTNHVYLIFYVLYFERVGPPRTLNTPLEKVRAWPFYASHQTKESAKTVIANVSETDTISEFNMGSSVQVPTYVLRDVVETDVLNAISADVVSHILASPPFISVPGLFNFRDLSYPHATLTSLKQNYIFRSGMLAFLEEEGKVKLTTGLGVKKVFDLRTAAERDRFPSPEIEGVQIHWLPTAQDTVRFNWADYAVGDPAATMLKMYQNILVTHVPIYRAVFEHIRDFPKQPFFFHCTALYGSLLGKKDLDESTTRGILVAGGIMYETMVQFLGFVEEGFENGAEGYLRDKLGFTSEDIETIRTNLRG